MQSTGVHVSKDKWGCQSAGDTSTIGGIDREVVFQRPLQIDLKRALQTAALRTWRYINGIWEVVNKQ